MASDLRSRALAAIREGRVVVRGAGTRDERAPYRAHGVVYGHTGRHEVALADGVWSCSCPTDEPCAHIAAMALVCGRPDLAARPTTKEITR